MHLTADTGPDTEVDDQDPTAQSSGPSMAGKPPTDSESPTGATPSTRMRRALARLQRQWEAPDRPSGRISSIQRTVPEDPEGGPFLQLLGISEGDIDRAFEAWEEAQLASNRLPLGRILHPWVVLVPWGRRWWVGRHTGLSCAIDGIGHDLPAAALRAAAVRYRMGVGSVLDVIAEALIPDQIAADDKETSGDAETAGGPAALRQDVLDPTGAAEVPAGADSGETR